MSTNTCTYERFEIQNRNDSTKEVLQKLTEYIYRLNRMEVNIAVELNTSAVLN